MLPSHHLAMQAPHAKAEANLQHSLNAVSILAPQHTNPYFFEVGDQSTSFLPFASRFHLAGTV